jgi:hypothetical protein
MQETSTQPIAESPSSIKPLPIPLGYTVLDAFGLRIGSVCSFEPDSEAHLDHFCVETTTPGLGRRRHLIPVSYVTNVNQNSRFLQLSRLKHESFALLVPDVTGSFPEDESRADAGHDAPETS